jgi:hypothetical protein
VIPSKGEVAFALPTACCRTQRRMAFPTAERVVYVIHRRGIPSLSLPTYHAGLRSLQRLKVPLSASERQSGVVLGSHGAEMLA